MRQLHPCALAPRLAISVAIFVAACWQCHADDVDYLTEIKPLLSEKCYSCHGSLKQEADLRLETLALMKDAGAIVPNEPDSSELIARIRATDDLRMPPPDDGAALHPDEIALIERWIQLGAPAPDEETPAAPDQHWAFQPVHAVESYTPDTSNQNPIDYLLNKKRSELGIGAVHRADRSILIRRLYLDLVGLPPTIQQLDDDRPWDTIVDELLNSPQHGERWARHWMDVWRYSDWYGLGQQIRYSQKHIWRWRDWIIDSLNQDKGYDRMIQEMLAGDELAPTNIESLAATGFLARNYYLFNRTTWLDNTIEHTGKAFLGLTLNCAKCHDHKYDPISHVDYYRFRALFEPHQVRLDPIDGNTNFAKDGLPRVFDDAIDCPTYLQVRGDEKQPDKDHPIPPGVPQIFASFAPPIEPVSLPRWAFAPGARRKVQEDKLQAAKLAVASAKKALKTANEKLAATPIDEAQSTHQLDEAFEVLDTFDAANPDVWELVGGDWEYRDGELRQTVPTRDKNMARLIPLPPQDFLVDCYYTTTGGSKYKSVTFRFDQSDDARDSNFVYTSAHEPGPKVHVAYCRNGTNSYPPEGRKTMPINIGQRYHLRFAVRDKLVNVWLDDQLVVAYELPDRKKGFFSISGFDATVAFDEIQIRSLPPEAELSEAKNQTTLTTEDAKQAVKAAEAKLTSAEASLAAIRSTVSADNARFEIPNAADEATPFAKNAAIAQLNAQIADAKYREITDSADAKKLKTAQQQLKSFQKRLKTLETATDPATYEPLRGSQQALESPADKQSDYAAIYSSVSSGRRLALAKWMTSSRNPLTARVAVNQVWMRHFGTPLVESVFDFGLRAKKPLQIDVLDYLASDFIKSGWSFKHLHRRIVTSQAYQLASTHNENRDTDSSSVSAEKDPNNQYYWRSNPRRMESQLVRDSLLALSGKLVLDMGGPPDAPDGKTYRRSLYLKHSRDQQDKFLTMFDDADILQCYRRSESIVPQQALALSNSRLAIDSSDAIAVSLAATLPATPTDQVTKEFIDVTFKRLLCRSPTRQEQLECQTFADSMAKLPIIQSLDTEKRIARIRSRLVHAILNHNDFVTVR